MRIFSIAIALALMACAIGSTISSFVLAQTPPEPTSISWFYGHPAPTISAAAAIRRWHDCVAAAAARLDDHLSSVMDIAAAIEPICSTRENTMIDAELKEFLDKNPHDAAHIGILEVDRLRRREITDFRKNIGTIILTLRRKAHSAERPLQATSQQQKDAVLAAKSCMLAKNPDDGASDAAAIGRVLLSACAREFRNVTRTFFVMDKLSKADLSKVTKHYLAIATKFVLEQRELVAKAKRCMDHASRVADAAVAAHPELLDRILNRIDDYSKTVLKSPRSCPPFFPIENQSK